MQVSKFLLTVCTMAVCAGIISVHAQDNPAQAAARAALMATMSGESAPAEPQTNAPILVDSSGVVTQQLAPSAQTNQIATPPAAPTVAVPVAQLPVTAPTSSDNEAQAMAREVLLQQMAQQPVEVPAPAPVTAIAPVPTIAVAPAKPVTPPPVTPEMKPVAASPANVSKANYPGKESGFTPIIAPPLPISATKQEQLEALLAKYKADEISPEEYQRQRAAILAEP